MARKKLRNAVYKPRLQLKSGGIEKFLGKAFWLYPRRRAPVSRHALRCCVDRLECLQQLVDVETYSALLRRCGDVGAADEGKQLHRILDRFGRIATPFFANLTMEMYGKLGLVEDACSLFKNLGFKRNFHSWSTMTAVFARHGQPEQAAQLLRWGQLQGFRVNLQMRGLLVCAFTQCGDLSGARRVLEEKEEINPMWWNVLLAAYVDRGLNKEAIRVALHSACGVKPTSHTYITLAAACGNLRDYGAAREIHSEILHVASPLLARFSSVCCALVRMYAKCGKMEDARRVFEAADQQVDSCCWAAIIGAYLEQGMGREALWMYKRMNLEGLPLPDALSYAAIIQACALCGKEFDSEAELVHQRFAADTAHTAARVPDHLLRPLLPQDHLLLPANVCAALNLMTTRGWRQLRKAK